MDDDLEVFLIVEIDNAAWQHCTLRYLEEGRWHNHDGLMVRVDPARAELHLRRHVHIAEPRHVSAKNKQVSWNDQGARHDRGTFNTKFPKMTAAKELARTKLGAGPEVVFEEVSNAAKLRLLTESLGAETDILASSFVKATILRATLNPDS